MNSIKHYVNQRRDEATATLTLLTTVSLGFWLPAVWYDKPLLVLGVWLISISGILGHAWCMVLCHARRNKRGIGAQAVALLLAASLLPANAAEPPLPTTPVPFEFTMSLDVSGEPFNPDDPQPIILPAVCVGVGVGVLGWVGLKIISACLDMQHRRATNRANAFVAAADNAGATQPVTGEECNCQTLPEGQPLPLRLEHSQDGRAWNTVAMGMTAGERQFIPRDGRWRITPMRIEARHGYMTVPPGTLEVSPDLIYWHVVSVSSEIQTVIPEPPNFYRIR